jgi:hypothetical protein
MSSKTIMVHLHPPAAERIGRFHGIALPISRPAQSLAGAMSECEMSVATGRGAAAASAACVAKKTDAGRGLSAPGYAGTVPAAAFRTLVFERPRSAGQHGARSYDMHPQQTATE